MPSKQKKTNHIPILKIISPKQDSAFSKDIVKIEVRAMIEAVHCEFKIIKPIIVKPRGIAIMVDDRINEVCKIQRSRKATFVATVNLKNFKEGKHKLKAVMHSARRRFRTKKLLESDTVRFFIDRTAPKIKSVFPSEGINVKKDDFTRVLVEAEDKHSGFMLKKCKVYLDDQALGNPIEHKRGLVFNIDKKQTKGTHKIYVEVCDKANNKAKYNSEFEVVLTPAYNKDEEKYWEKQREVLKKKLETDPKFRRKILTDPRAAIVEFGLPYTKEVSRFFPPPMPEKQADFFLSVDPENAKKTLEPLRKRILEALNNRDNERIKKIVERLAGDGMVADDGGLTDYGKNLFSRIFQDPVGMLQSIGVTLTGKEKECIPQPFPKEFADRYAEYYSSLQSDKPIESSREKRAALESAEQRASLDIEEQIKWFSDPKTALKETYPEATAEEIAALPKPISEKEARRLLSPIPNSTVIPPDGEYHNSTDVVMGVSVSFMNKALEFYFTEIKPDLFPIIDEGEYSTVGPYPYGKLTYLAQINQPGNIQVIDTNAKLISTTVDGSLSVTLEDGSKYSIELALSPIYSISADDKFVYLNYNDINVDFRIIEKGVEIPLPEVSDEISQFINWLIFTVYPTGRIPIFKQSHMRQGFSLADVEVCLENIFVYDDNAPIGAAELYFEINIAGTKYFFGEFKAGSGSSITLNRRYLLKQGQSPFSISIRGKERDLASFDDYLGDDTNLHSTKNGSWTYGRFCLRGITKKGKWNLVWDIICWVLVEVLCWFEEVVVDIVNKYGELIGHKNVLRKRCRKELQPEYGWIWRLINMPVTNYMLQYSIIPKEPVSITPKLRDFSLDNNNLYLGFDFSVPGIGDQTCKTSARGFVGSADMGLALSENILNKLIQMLWHYCPVPHTFSEGSIDDRGFHATLHVGPSKLCFWPNKSIVLYIPIDGKAGIFCGPIHIKIGTPSRACAYLNLAVQDDKLLVRLDKVWFSGGNTTTLLLNYLSSIYYVLSEILPIRKRQIALLEMLASFSVEDHKFELKPYPPMGVNEREIILNFSLDGRSGRYALPVNTTHCMTPIGAGIYEDFPCLLFVANSNKGHKEIHRVDCIWAQKIYSQNRYLVFGTPDEIVELYEKGRLPEKVNTLIDQGYNGCYYCMEEFHTE